jgi:uncharacterized repeat protein (TIGR03847 family)
MARRVYLFENPDRFVAGAVGQPGSRIFYLQAREGSRVVSVVIEKPQVALLAERLTELLAEVRSRGANVPDDLSTGEVDRAPLEEPLVEAFRVGTMAIVWDGDDESVVVEAREITVDEGDEETDEETAETEDDEDGDLMRVHMEPRKALAFAGRALEVVAAGRPPCPFCGQPLNPEGHICTRRNGYMH